MPIVIHMSREVHIFFAILNLVLCAVLIIVRFYHQKKEKKKVLNLSVTALSCMLLGFLTCLGVLSSESWFGGRQHCRLILKLNGAAYSLHRVLLYTFIILRLEVVNQSALINPRIITVGKVVIGVAGTFIVLTSTLAAEGITTDEQYTCLFRMDDSLLATLFVIDISVCVGGTCAFLRPLRLTLRSIESESVRNILKRTITWSIVCLMSTFTTLLTIAVFDGSGGAIAFDCSVTCFSLVMMMSPVKPQLLSKNKNNSRQKASAEIEEMSSVVGKKPSSGVEPST